MKNSTITKQVNQLLAEHNITKPPVPVAKLARDLGARIRVGPLPDELSGFLLREENTVTIGVNSLHPKSRQLFTLAHELGHLRLHPAANFVDRSFFYFRDARSADATDSREMEANQFAADLLMPEPFILAAVGKHSVDLEDEDQISALATRFGVSGQALVYRLMNLNLTRKSQ